MSSTDKQGSSLGSFPTSPPLYPHFNRPSGFWPCVKSCLVGGSDKYSAMEWGGGAWWSSVNCSNDRKSVGHKIEQCGYVWLGALIIGSSQTRGTSWNNVFILLISLGMTFIIFLKFKGIIKRIIQRTCFEIVEAIHEGSNDGSDWDLRRILPAMHRCMVEKLVKGD